METSVKINTNKACVNLDSLKNFGLKAPMANPVRASVRVFAPKISAENISFNKPAAKPISSPVSHPKNSPKNITSAITISGTVFNILMYPITVNCRIKATNKTRYDKKGLILLYTIPLLI